MDKNGFHLIKKQHSEDLQSDVSLFEHKKSGARLLALENNDKNKVFMIGFRTPSNNSTGVAHIMEHSTLCGSRKYPVKEPFVELAKGSLNTFLNAMTYPDKTVYPVASTNDKDFRNLTDVYLDAVLYPNIYNNPYTFMQEGWHYHLENQEDPIKYNGVVYNEMKGVYSDPDALVERETFKALFPDTIYGEESGGDPDFIPELTFKDFKNFHQNFYHPSNSYIYLYGDIDLDEQLEYLDSWLKDFDKKEVNSKIQLQEKPDKRTEVEFKYPVPPGANKVNKDIIALSFALDDSFNSTKTRALAILLDVILDSNSSIVKKKLLEAGLAENIDVIFDTPMLQPVISIILKNTDKNKKEEFLNLFNEIIEDLIQNGIDKDHLQSSININEFRTLEALSGEGSSFPKGLPIGLNILENWLYDKDPFEKIDITKSFDEVNQLKEENGFENILKEVFIDNPHQSLVILEPDEEVGKIKEQRLKDSLEEYKNSLSQEEIDELVSLTQNLIEAQNKVDSPEELATIPHIKVSEIDKERTKIEYELSEIDNSPLLYVEGGSKDIIYLNLNFDFSTLDNDELPYLSVLENLLNNISTQTLNYIDLSQKLDMYTGGINHKITIYEDPKTLKIIPVYSVQSAFRIENIKQTLELMQTILLETIFTEKDIIKNLIQEERIHHKAAIQNNGNVVASNRLQSYFSKQARIAEELDGIEFYKFLTYLDENFDEIWPELSQKLQKIYSKLINKNQLTISLACQKKYYDEVIKELNPVVESINAFNLETNEFDLAPIKENEAFITPGNVMYNALGGKISDKDSINFGALQVLKTMLSMDYLWNKVRVLGGAYGAGFGFNKSGNIFMTSFRDPNLEKTYENFNGIIDYVENLDLTQEELDKYIIGTISGMDIPFSTKEKLRIASQMYYTNSNNEERQKFRDEILSTTVEDIKSNLDGLKDAIGIGYKCTIGTDSAINNSEELFNEVEYIK